MFGFLDLLTKRVNDQIAEYAALQSDVARRYADWLDPFHACQPVKIRVDRRPCDPASAREAARRR